MKRLALPLLIASILAASASAESFTNAAGSCHVYKLQNGMIEYYCYGMPVTYDNGTQGSLSFTAYFTTSGTFTGSLYKDGYLFAGDLNGTFSGPQSLPTSLSGSFTGGTLPLQNFGLRTGPCYKGTCFKSPYVTHGSGSFI